MRLLDRNEMLPDYANGAYSRSGSGRGRRGAGPIFTLTFVFTVFALIGLGVLHLRTRVSINTRQAALNGELESCRDESTKLRGQLGADTQALQRELSQARYELRECQTARRVKEAEVQSKENTIMEHQQEKQRLNAMLQGKDTQDGQRVAALTQEAADKGRQVSDLTTKLVALQASSAQRDVEVAEREKQWQAVADAWADNDKQLRAELTQLQEQLALLRVNLPSNLEIGKFLSDHTAPPVQPKGPVVPPAGTNLLDPAVRAALGLQPPGGDGSAASASIRGVQPDALKHQHHKVGHHGGAHDYEAGYEQHDEHDQHYDEHDDHHYEEHDDGHNAEHGNDEEEEWEEQEDEWLHEHDYYFGPDAAFVDGEAGHEHHIPHHPGHPTHGAGEHHAGGGGHPGHPGELPHPHRHAAGDAHAHAHGQAHGHGHGHGHPVGVEQHHHHVGHHHAGESNVWTGHPEPHTAGEQQASGDALPGHEAQQHEARQRRMMHGR